MSDINRLRVNFQIRIPQVMFFSDLVKELTIPVEIDFIRCKSYFGKRQGDLVISKDLETKIKHIIEFLQDEKKVQITMKFRSREMQHKEVGFEKINIILEQCKQICLVESNPKFEGSRLVCRLAPQKTN